MNMKDKTMQLRLGMLFAILVLGVAACGGGTLSSVGGPSYPYPSPTTYPTAATYYTLPTASPTVAPLSVISLPGLSTGANATSLLDQLLPALTSSTYTPAKLKVEALSFNPTTPSPDPPYETPVMYFEVTACHVTGSSQCSASSNTITLTGVPGYEVVFENGCPSTSATYGIASHGTTTSGSTAWTVVTGLTGTCTNGNTVDIPYGTTTQSYTSSTSYYELYY